jgi:crotonobetainyl-CoA:carnitine CoA-transferase CaiB-like acyl-CoA transferase
LRACWSPPTPSGFASNADRVEQREALVALLNQTLATAAADEWVRRLAARGVPCGTVNGIDEAVELAARLGLEPVVAVRDDRGRVSRQARHPIWFSATPATYRLAPPTWDQVLRIEDVVALLPPPDP